MSDRSRLIAACAAYAFFVVYGSLVPLDFVPLAPTEALARFSRIPFLDLDVASRADWVANGVLYLPLGVLAAASARALRGGGAAPWLAFVVVAALAVAVEFAQLFFPPRTVSQNDLLAEFIGAGLGIVLAPLALAAAGRLRAGLAGGLPVWGPRLLELYALAWVALALFPYDLLLSPAELADKLRSGQCGWLFAATDHAPMAALKLAVEAAMAAPLGWLLALRWRVRPATAAAAGAAVGLVLEVAQLLLASGVSQGASVLARAAGFAAGAALAPRLAAGGAPAVAALLRRFTPAVVVAWLPLLAAVNGWLAGPWHGLDGAAQSWRELRLLPFYYHYYTTEALALQSALGVALAYLPLAALAWAWGRPARAAALWVLAAVALVEAGKLFLGGGRHPDPTNLLIAPAAAWLLHTLLRLLAEAPKAAPAPASGEGGAPTAMAVPARAPRWPWLALPPLLGLALLFQPFAAALAIGLAAAAAAVAWRPLLALALIPAALPVLDLAPWTGRVFVDEFDLLLLACVAVAAARVPRPAAGGRAPAAVALAFVLLALSFTISGLRALWPLSLPAAGDWWSFTSPVNTLRILKGGVEAWLVVWLWRRLERDGAARATAFGAGMAAGLALTVAWIVAERSAFAGLLDFAAGYRVTGPFSAMHRGGAYVECYLAMALAFVLAATLQARRPAARAAGVLLLAAGGYALAVTYSRNGWVAGALALAVTAALALSGRGTPRGRRGLAAAALALTAAAALPVLLGPYAQERLGRSGQDLATRQAHWADALELRGPGLASVLFGAGPGRYPDLHYWGSREPVHAARHAWQPEGGRGFLRLAPGATLYVEQIVDPGDARELVLSAALRRTEGPVALAVTLCRKSMLSSRDCSQATLEAAADTPAPGGWARATATLAVPPGALPLKLSLLTPARAPALDVGELSLRDAAGTERLANGSFAQGLARWFFATDIDPPWHVHSLPVAVLFDQGWFGAAAWGALILAAAGAALARGRRGLAPVPAALGALAALLASGLLNTLVDTPRFLLLALLLPWLAAAAPVDSPRGEGPPAPGPGAAP